jgi:hypothetical protein
MTKQEYNWYHTEREDALSHKIRVGDLVAFHRWDSRVTVGKVVRICKEVIKIEPLNYKHWTVQRHPYRVIKLKEDAIPDD